MKLICIQDHKTVRSGLLRNDKTKKKIEGLTKGKTYYAQLANTSNHGYFLIYDDYSEWSLYETKYFKPTEEG